MRHGVKFGEAKAWDKHEALGIHVILAPEIEMAWESDKVAGVISMPNYATASATGHEVLADQVLLEREGDGWKCVVHCVDDTLYLGERKTPA